MHVRKEVILGMMALAMRYVLARGNRDAIKVDKDSQSGQAPLELVKVFTYKIKEHFRQMKSILDSLNIGYQGLRNGLDMRLEITNSLATRKIGLGRARLIHLMIMLHHKVEINGKCHKCGEKFHK